MKKKIATLLLISGMVASICGCGNQKLEENTSSINNEETTKIEVTEKINITDENEEKDAISFAEFKDLQFVFSSGAGGWATMLMIEEDGSFSGEYFDGEMGITGENYPNGTMYQSVFTGQFMELERVNEYTYSMKISELNYEKEVGKEEIKDGVKYCYSEAYGLEKGNKFFVYLPNAPIEELPEEFRNWVGYYELSNETEKELPFYGLYNEEQQCGFSSYKVQVDSLEEINTSIEDGLSILKQTIENEEVIQLIISTEKEAALLESFIKNDAITQIEYNEKTKQLYEVWDFALNKIWGILKETLDKEVMSQLTIEEREWIAFKEQEVAKAGAEYEGGSIQPMIMNQKAAEMTKERVYELIKLLQ